MGNRVRLVINKWLVVFNDLGNDQPKSKIMKNRNITYGHINNVSKELIDRGYLERYYKKNVGYHTLTKKGKKLHSDIQPMIRRLDCKELEI